MAETGVDFISVGALTHSAPALDLSLHLEAVVIRLAVALAAAALVVPQAAGAAPLDELLGCCRSREAARTGSAPRSCRASTARPSTPRSRYPTNAPRKGLPLIVFLHGFLTDKGEYLSRRPRRAQTQTGAATPTRPSSGTTSGGPRRGTRCSTTAPSGQGASGGQVGPARRHLEVRDTHHLTGLLVDDPRLRLRPRRVAVLGSSYGGGQAWLLLTTRGEGSAAGCRGVAQSGWPDRPPRRSGAAVHMDQPAPSAAAERARHGHADRDRKDEHRRRPDGHGQHKAAPRRWSAG